MEVRDPIHGGIDLDEAEAAILHQPFIQRMRMIRALGFSYIPFPGANHSRFAHSLGVMHLAGLAFDRAYRSWTFENPEARRRFRAAVRLAGLCHDLGHAPFSHCSEFAMPPAVDLPLAWYREPPRGRRASHEDYTIAILGGTALGPFIDTHFPCRARHVAALISDDVVLDDDFFLDGGLDHRRLLGQIISSELDADRLDYLVRDAYFSGARYGMVDVPWILSNLSTYVADGTVSLAIDSLGQWAFEDFLVARHHMFLQVYYHHTSVIYEEMLRLYVHESGDWQIPSDLEAYRWLDDVALEAQMRKSSNEWARRVVCRNPYRRIVERHDEASADDVKLATTKLKDAGIYVISTESTSALSRYAAQHDGGERAVWLNERLPGQLTSSVSKLYEASRVFERYADPLVIRRIYVSPEERDHAFEVLGIQRV